MIPKRLGDVTYEDLEDLLRSEVREGKSIDYKRALPGNSEGQKKEFLYDVSSFANTVGGDLIIGVDEDKGLPVEIPAFSCENIDEELQRLDSILMSGVEPRLKGTSKIPK
jgi:predicted HTH transcriptional regulator